MTRPLPARVAILGCNGYLGALLMRALVRMTEVELVLGVGRQPAAAIKAPKVHYVRGDLGTLPLTELFANHAIEAIGHCAFISRPMHDEREAYRCNVTATERVFAAARAVGVEHAVLVSSIAVYGPRTTADLVAEDTPTSPNSFVFSRHKVLQEHTAWQQLQGGQGALTVVRPCTVVGPGARNFVLDFLTRSFTPVPLAHDPSWQFLHEDDFVDAVLGLLRARTPGIYNLAPDDAVSLRDAVRLLGGVPLPVPRWLLHAVVGLGWHLHVPSVPGPRTALPFLCQPPLAANRRLRQLVGQQIRHTSREALLALCSGPIPDPTCSSPARR